MLAFGVEIEKTGGMRGAPDPQLAMLMLMTLSTEDLIPVGDVLDPLPAGVLRAAHVAPNTKHSAIDARTTRHAGHGVSQRIRKRIEEPFGWTKTIGGGRQLRYRGRDRNRAWFKMTVDSSQLQAGAQEALFSGLLTAGVGLNQHSHSAKTDLDVAAHRPRPDVVGLRMNPILIAHQVAARCLPGSGEPRLHR